jgi:hypothetical protein
MTFADLLVAQLLDPFRIGLLIALVFTTLQTAAHTGRLIPLALGGLFVAVLIATTTGSGEVGQAIAAGVVTNAMILAVILGLHAIWKRVVRSGG